MALAHVQPQPQPQQHLQDEPNFVLELSARHVHEELWSRFAVCCGTEHLVFSPVYSHIISCLDKLHLTAHVLNFNLYEWYLGNVTSDFIIAVFMPYVNRGVGLQEAERYRNCLTARQAQDAFCTLYMLVHKGGVRCDVLDYYGHTPAEQLQDLPNNMPRHLVELVPAFRALFAHGDGLAALQQACIRRFLARRMLQHMQEEKLQRQRAAVRVIESWWFDIITSPYTEQGERYLKNHFHKLRTRLAADNAPAQAHAMHSTAVTVP